MGEGSCSTGAFGTPPLSPSRLRAVEWSSSIPSSLAKPSEPWRRAGNGATNSRSIPAGADLAIAMVAQTGQPGPAQSPAAALAAVRDDLDQFDRLLADDQGELSHTVPERSLRSGTA